MTIPSRAEVAGQAREAGQKIAAVLPIHHPRELLRAHGFHPMEVWGPPGIDPSEATPHFQAYACGIVRNATAFLLRGKLDVAEALVIPHTCDALQGMASVLKDFVKPKQPVLTLYLPRGRRKSDGVFLVEELRRLGRELGAISGVFPSDGELLRAVKVEEEVDEVFGELARNRGHIDLSDREYFTLLRSREYLPPETFVELARSAPRGTPPDAAAPLMISGIVPEPMALFDHIQEMGGRVVSDDLACGSRRVYPAGHSQDPWVRMAERLLGTVPCPTRGSPIAERAAYLAERMAESGARGLLVYDVKFCEPELFDLPQLRQRLSAQGFPMLHVEVDLARTIAQQSLTRIEAFIEMLA